jgi:hypothetical protein
MHVLQRRRDIEHAAACEAVHVPGQFENAELFGVQEGGDGALLVEPVRAANERTLSGQARHRHPR